MDLMFNGINFLAILLAALASLVVGFIWYSLIFRELWLKLTGIDTENRKGMWKMMLQNQAINIVGILFFYVIIQILSLDTYMAIIGITLMLCATFTMPPILADVIWKRKPWLLGLIDSGGFVVQFIAISSVLFMFI